MGRGKSSADASSLTAGFAAAGIVTRPGVATRPGEPNESGCTDDARNPSLAQLYDMDAPDLIAFLERSLFSDGRLRGIWPIAHRGPAPRGPQGCQRGAINTPKLLLHHGVGGLISREATCVHLVSQHPVGSQRHELVLFSQHHHATGEDGRCVVMLTDGPHLEADVVRVIERIGDCEWTTAQFWERKGVRKILTQFTVPS